MPLDDTASLPPLLALALLLPLCSAASYHQCDFSCSADPLPSNWTQCRAERCKPFLPEDMCPDGSEPTLVSSQPSHPHDCPVQPTGSFAERCEICLSFSREATRAGMRGAVEIGESPEELCELAREETLALLPTVRPCRFDERRCLSLLDTFEKSTCRNVWKQLREGARRSVIMRQQQEECGEILRHREGTGVSEAELCAPPRDLSNRVVLLSVIAASALFAGQAYFGA